VDKLLKYVTYHQRDARAARHIVT